MINILHGLHNIILIIFFVLTFFAMILESYYILKNDYEAADFAGGLRSLATTSLSIAVAMSVLKY